MTIPTLQSAPSPGVTLDEDPLAGTGYRSLGPLGKGATGEVVEAEHVALGHRVAVKLLRTELFWRYDVRDRLRLEAQMCARVRHENLVAVTDYGETLDGRPFLVMERLYGRSLGDELRARGPLPVDEAVDIARQALAGLSAAHAALVVHRDLKPDNLFLCAASGGGRRVKVLDFGLAKLAEVANPYGLAPLAQPTTEGLTVGTPHYAAPEQSRGERSIDGRADVYAMGWILNAMLTGREPFPEKKTAAELSRAHATEWPPAPSAVAPWAIPPELDAIVRRAIAKRPEERFASAEAFSADLARVAQSRGGAQRRGPETPGRLTGLDANGQATGLSIASILVACAVVLGGVGVTIALRLLGVW